MVQYLLDSFMYRCCGSRIKFIKNLPLYQPEIERFISRTASGLAKFRNIPTIPIVTEVKDNRKLTDQNLSNLLNLLVSFVNSRGLIWGPQLVAAVSTFMDFIFNAVSNDSVRAIKELKVVRSYYIAILRGDALPKDFTPDFRYLNKSKYSITHKQFAQILALQLRLFKTVRLTPESKVFCEVVLALLDSNRVITMSKDPDYTSITKPSSMTADSEKINKEAAEAIKRLPFTVDEFKEALADEARSWEHVVSEKGGDRKSVV